MHVEFERNDANEMPAVANPTSFGSARIWKCNYKSLDHFGQFSELQTLEILGFPDDTLGVLSALRKLRYLRIIHLPKVSDLSPLADLQALETLALETLPSWDASGKVTVVNSLDPIGDLKKLRHLNLLGVRSEDKSLAALERCPSLESARISKLPKKDVERFYAATRVSNAFVPDPEFDLDRPLDSLLRFE